MSTLATFLNISQNQTRYDNITASEPMVQSQTAYYQANIGSVKTPADLVNNYRLFSYVMTAYGLGDQVYAKAEIEKVLDQGVSSSQDLAYTLDNSNILALAQTFNFAADGTSTTSSQAVQTGVVNQYVEQQMETDQGQSNPGVQLALYFQAHASSITSVYNILGDTSLLTVVETALGISPLMSDMNIDEQASMLSQKLNVADFQDPTKLQNFLEKFAAMYDMDNPNASTSTASTTVPDFLISDSSSSTFGISTSLLNQIQGLQLGGV